VSTSHKPQAKSHRPQEKGRGRNYPRITRIFTDCFPIGVNLRDLRIIFFVAEMAEKGLTFAAGM
jgi:hypothetical protein